MPYLERFEFLSSARPASGSLPPTLRESAADNELLTAPYLEGLGVAPTTASTFGANTEGDHAAP